MPEKRNVRTYKIADTPYGKAMKRGRRQMPLSNVLEEVAKFYGQGYAIMVRDVWGNYGTIADLQGLSNGSKKQNS